VAVAVAVALGVNVGSETVIVERPAAVGAGARLAASSTTRDLPTGRGSGLDAPRLFRERAAGVVTVSAGTKKDAVSGSGFVASADGHIITNAHVITTSPDADAAADVRPLEDVYVRFADGNSLPARIVGYDLFDDIGVLKVDPARADLHPLVFGRAADLEVGEPLAVIGSPFGKRQEQSLSVGVVSAVGRSLLAPSVSFETPGAFQTDAAINHGNSGGPVFDARGRVVGVAAQIESTGGGGEGVGFAIPAEAAERSLRDLVAGRAVAYAWLGVSTVPVSAELARRFDLPTTAGLLVDTLTSGGPAADAGLRAGRRSEAFQDDALPLHPDGDILTAFNGTPLATTDDLGRAVATARPGDRAVLDVYRDGKRRQVSVRLGTRPTNVGD
jgi:S1-C subfamily serine protease